MAVATELSRGFVTPTKKQQMRNIFKRIDFPTAHECACVVVYVCASVYVRVCGVCLCVRLLLFHFSRTLTSIRTNAQMSTLKNTNMHAHARTPRHKQVHSHEHAQSRIYKYSVSHIHTHTHYHANAHILTILQTHTYSLSSQCLNR